MAATAAALPPPGFTLRIFPRCSGRSAPRPRRSPGSTRVPRPPIACSAAARPVAVALAFLHLVAEGTRGSRLPDAIEALLRTPCRRRRRSPGNSASHRGGPAAGVVVEWNGEGGDGEGEFCV